MWVAEDYNNGCRFTQRRCRRLRTGVNATKENRMRHDLNRQPFCQLAAGFENLINSPAAITAQQEFLPTQYAISR